MAKKSAPELKAKGKRAPKSPAAKMAPVDKAPAVSGNPIPFPNAPMGVAANDGDGIKIQVTAEMAKMAPHTKGERCKQGESQEMPKADDNGRNY